MTLTYDYENRLTSATVGGVVTQYAYNGDSARVKKTVSGTPTYYVGNWYEVTNGVVTKYYYFGAQRVAMKQGSTLTYLHGDHLGSTSVASDMNGVRVSRQTYYAFGVPRTTEGTLPTDYTFTGQKYDSSDALMFYNARYYDAAIGRFTQPDTIIPDQFNPQSLNRYAYVRNNPVRYTDPTGHCDPDNCKWTPDEDGDLEMHIKDSDGSTDGSRNFPGWWNDLVKRIGLRDGWSTPAIDIQNSRTPFDIARRSVTASVNLDWGGSDRVATIGTEKFRVDLPGVTFVNDAIVVNATGDGWEATNALASDKVTGQAWFYPMDVLSGELHYGFSGTASSTRLISDDTTFSIRGMVRFDESVSITRAGGFVLGALGLNGLAGSSVQQWRPSPAPY